MDSGGFHWTPDIPLESTRFCWSPDMPLVSTGFRQSLVIPLDSTGVRWICSAEKVRMDSTDSAGICWFPVDSAGLLPE